MGHLQDSSSHSYIHTWLRVQLLQYTTRYIFPLLSSDSESTFPFMSIALIRTGAPISYSNSTVVISVAFLACAILKVLMYFSAPLLGRRKKSLSPTSEVISKWLDPCEAR